MNSHLKIFSQYFMIKLIMGVRIKTGYEVETLRFWKILLRLIFFSVFYLFLPI